MKRAVVIGHFDWKENNMIGAVVKARSILEVMQKRYSGDEIGNVDIYNWRDSFFRTLHKIVASFAKYHSVVLVCSDTSRKLMTLFGLLKKIFRNRIFYCAVGGDLADLLSRNPKQKKMLSCIDCFFVETLDCLKGMKNLGIKKIVLMKNFKCIKPIAADKVGIMMREPYRFCTFSRVIKEKGITDAINAVKDINNQYGRTVCELDIYGTVDHTYADEFDSLINQNDNVRYLGVVDASKAVEVLHDYYCLLFPTKYQTEGIPGTIIDGFAAGLPVICSDWVRCRQIVHDSVDGLIYPFDDYNGLILKMEYAIDNPQIMNDLRKNARDSYMEYRPEYAARPLFKMIRRGEKRS